ncbi:NAD(P)/FAD-dependent oxidoreductase [Saccharopolyspora rosea]|uniref:NAD(P)/FAD-dependent oxidoreductase n=1 Tax=Saccharopolyspora rosea TaxID=524884 RepID=A0ABW3FWI2_9PSEU|nr:FAD-dependent oxidoreductase [Saccharopolyspora rosea]
MTGTGPVVVLGTGQAGQQTAISLRQAGFDGRVVLVGDEPELPYRRPPLSKGYLTGDVDAAGLLLRTADYYAAHDIEVLPAQRAVEILRSEHRVRLRDGRSLDYQHLVLALGSRNREVPVPSADLPGVLGLRTLADADALRDRLRSARDVVVVGGGFVGLEVATSASAFGARVTVVEAQERLLARVATPQTSEFFARAHRSRGVRLLLGHRVARFLGDDSVSTVEIESGERIAADLVLVGAGAVPDVELAREAGLAERDGVVVDAWLRTSDPDISAIGDCARFPSPFAAEPVRIESVQNAVDQARCVAARLTGAPAEYRAVPWFWSDQAGTRLQIAGLTGGHDRTVLRGDPDSGRFSVFCFRGNALLGADSVGRPAEHLAVRRLLGTGPAPNLTPDQAADPDFDVAGHARAADPR